MNNPHPISLRRRLQALQAIPDSERTEAQWDELNELEIMLAPGNRVATPRDGDGRGDQPSGQSNNRRAKPATGEPRRKPVKRVPRRAPKSSSI